MEQGEDSHSFRALQCGRRMFLSALILASKYLQDRNYSARAWSKISGLNTQEINQNEISFLLAVNWRLHITNELFQRWAGIVLKYTPPSPPSPGSPASLEHEIRSAEWKSIILGLNVELDNVEDIQILSASSAVLSNMSRLAEPVITRTYTSSPRSPRSTPAPAYATPHYLEPCPSTVYCVSKAAPAYGLLPTPKLTPRCVGFRTPAAIPSSYYPGSAMAFAQSQACHAPFTEKWVTSSPRTFNGCRRSSLTNSTSTTSSPESMISDTSSRSSRSSSVSSASSAMSAPPYKLDVLARCRSAQQYVDAGLKDHNGFVSNRGFDGSRSTSPETEFPSSAKEIWTSHDSLTPLAITECNSCVDEVDVDAARTLQELQSSARFSRGAKRSRPKSIDNSAVSQARCIMQDDSQGWSDIVIRSANAPGTNAVSRAKDGRKRACCVAELCRNSLQTPTTSHVRYWK